jgi:amino acid transporter
MASRTSFDQQDQPVSGLAGESAESSKDYGLRREILSPLETLAQSVSTIAPTCTPAATIPLVCSLAGNGTWLAYVLATIAILLVAWCIGRFARYSFSPGSLYSYANLVLPSWVSSIAAWSLLLAYVGTAASVIGGFYDYFLVFIHRPGHHPFLGALLAAAVTGACIWISCRDVKISARLMLWIEVVSVLMIVVVVALVLAHQGFHIDADQLHLRGMTGSGLRLGLVLAIFSFVGFESATTLGTEAKDPLKTIPRAVMQSAVLGGIFFIVAAYTEVLGFRIAGQDLGTSPAPFHVLSVVGGLPLLGPVIDVGVLFSLFAGSLACITAAARVLLLMSYHGLAHKSFRATHVLHNTPHRAIIITGIASVVPVAVLALRGASGLDIYGWMGSLATYGFIVTYGLVSLALPRYLRYNGYLSPMGRVISLLASLAMLLALIGNLYPIPEGPYGKLPYVYLVYLAAGVLWFAVRGAKPQEHPS